MRGTFARYACSAIMLSLCGVGLVSCAHDAPPPLLSMDSRVCIQRPDFAHATPVKLDADHPAKITIDQTAPCLDMQDGERTGKVAYGLFQLPGAAEPYLASVDSDPIGTGLFAPTLRLLDGQGQLVRTISTEGFNFHGASLHTGFRVHAGDQYLMVESNPQLVGRQVTRIADSTQVNTYSGGLLYVQVHTGTDESQTLTYSVDGTITVTAMPIPKDH